jgi:hypothetical protein
MAYGQQFHRPEWKAREVLLVQPDCMQQILTEMDFATRKHGQDLASGSLPDLDLDLRIALCIEVQKSRHDTFDVLRRARYA